MLTRAVTIGSSLATAPSATPLPCHLPLNGMFHQASMEQIAMEQIAMEQIAMEQIANLKNM